MNKDSLITETIMLIKNYYESGGKIITDVSKSAIKQRLENIETEKRLLGNLLLLPKAERRQICK